MTEATKSASNGVNVQALLEAREDIEALVAQSQKRSAVYRVEDDARYLNEHLVSFLNETTAA